METFVLLSVYLKKDVVLETFKHLEPFYNVNEYDGMHLYRVIIILKMLFLLYSLEHVLPNYILLSVFAFSNAYIAYNYSEIAILSAAAQCLLIFAPNKKCALLVSMTSICILAMNIKPYEFILDLCVIGSITTYAWETYQKEIQKLNTVVSIVITMRWYICNLNSFSFATFVLIMCFLFLSYIPLKPNFHNKQRHRLLYCYALIFIWIIYKFQLANYHGMDTFYVKTNPGEFNNRWGICEESKSSRNVNISIDIQTENFSTHPSDTTTKISTKMLVNNLTSPNEMSINTCRTDENLTKKMNFNSFNRSVRLSFIDRKRLSGNVDCASYNGPKNEFKNLKEDYNDLKKTKNIFSSKMIYSNFNNGMEVLPEDNLIPLDKNQENDKFNSNVKSKRIEKYKEYLNKEIFQKDPLKPMKVCDLRKESSRKSTKGNCAFDNIKCEGAEEVSSQINWERHIESDSIENMPKMDPKHKLMLTVEENVKNQFEQVFSASIESEPINIPVLSDAISSVLSNKKIKKSENKEMYSAQYFQCTGNEKAKQMLAARSNPNLELSESADSIAETAGIESIEDLQDVKDIFLEEEKEIERNNRLVDTSVTEDGIKFLSSEMETTVKSNEEIKRKVEGEKEQEQNKLTLNEKYEFAETKKKYLVTENEETISNEIVNDVYETDKNVEKTDLTDGEISIFKPEIALESMTPIKNEENIKGQKKVTEQQFFTNSTIMNQTFMLSEEREKHLIGKRNRDMKTEQIPERRNIQEEFAPEQIPDRRNIQEEFAPIKNTVKENNIRVEPNIQESMTTFEKDSEDVIRKEIEMKKNGETFQNAVLHFQKKLESPEKSENNAKRKSGQVGLNILKDYREPMDTKEEIKGKAREYDSHEVESTGTVEVEKSAKEKSVKVEYILLKDQWQPIETKKNLKSKEIEHDSYKEESTGTVEAKKSAKEESVQIGSIMLEDQREPFETKGQLKRNERECNSFKVESTGTVEVEKSAKAESVQVEFIMLEDQWEPMKTKRKLKRKEREYNSYEVESTGTVEVEGSAKGESVQVESIMSEEQLEPIETKSKLKRKEREYNSYEVESTGTVEVEKSSKEESVQVGSIMLKDQRESVETKGKLKGNKREQYLNKESIRRVKTEKNTKKESVQVRSINLKDQWRPMETKAKRKRKERKCNSYNVESTEKVQVEKSAKEEESVQVGLDMLKDQWKPIEAERKRKERKYNSYKVLKGTSNMQEQLKVMRNGKRSRNAQVESENKDKSLENQAKETSDIEFKGMKGSHLMETVQGKKNARGESITTRKAEKSRSVDVAQDKRNAAEESQQHMSSAFKKITRRKGILQWKRDTKEYESTRPYNMQEEYESAETDEEEKEKQISSNIPDEPKSMEIVELKSNLERQPKQHEIFMQEEPELIEIEDRNEDSPPKNSLAHASTLQEKLKSLKNFESINLNIQKVNHINTVEYMENNDYSFIGAPDHEDMLVTNGNKMHVDDSREYKSYDRDILIESDTNEGVFLILRNRNGRYHIL